MPKLFETVSGDAGHRGRKRPFTVNVPPVVNPTGRIWENAAGGPYKYGHPIRVTPDTLRAVEAGVL